MIGKRPVTGNGTGAPCAAKTKHPKHRPRCFGDTVAAGNQTPVTARAGHARQVGMKKIPIPVPVQIPGIDIAQHLEQAALNDEYFVSRKLYPNVDFYSGIILRAIGIPVDMFPVMFAMGRMPGWIANWREVATNPKMKIHRPRQVYTGATERDYVPIEDRGE